MNDSLSDNRNDELLQSEKWMRFQEAAGREPVRLSGGGWTGNAVVHTLSPVGEYLYVPRGPRGKVGKDAAEALLREARSRKAAWIRIEPETDGDLSAIRDAVFGERITKAPHDIQPRETFVVDLRPSEEVLLSAMKPKTRYNIRVAEKRGVRVVVSTEGKYVDAFIRLVTGTADRKGITPHPRKYYEKMCEVLLGENGKIYAAEKEGEIIAANLVIFHGDTATYLHGGSDDRFRADMAPFLLQWEAMREAKRRGCARYDFGGVNMSELSAGTGRWLGITRFKAGFSPGTCATAFPGAYDIVLSPFRYAAYRLLGKARSLLSRSV